MFFLVADSFSTNRPPEGAGTTPTHRIESWCAHEGSANTIKRHPRRATLFLIETPVFRQVIASSVFGGLHHLYDLAA